MPVAETPNDNDVRQSYNFAPGYHGLVYRADTEPGGRDNENEPDAGEHAPHEFTYKLQSMQWGILTRTSRLYVL
jgi:hypothetical protein